MHCTHPPFAGSDEKSLDFHVPGNAELDLIPVDEPPCWLERERAPANVVIIESHRWVPLPVVGLSTSSFGEKEQEDVTLPPNLMEHPPLAVFVNGKL
ncbi:hypothetical protein Tco_0265966 [Tanacetum coccineum]